MTFNELCGVRSGNIDVETGVEITHSEKYQRAIRALGGLEAVVPFIPFSKYAIVRALRDGDEHLNSLPLSAWDRAAGFVGVGKYFRCVQGALWGLYAKRGVTSASCADGVCLLKEAARLWATT